MEMPGNKLISDKMNELVWEAFPQLVYQKLSKSLGRTLNDGSYLANLWKYAFLLAPILFTLGIITGGTHITFVGQEVYTFSITIMICMIIPAVFSGCLGWWLCLGYGIGDLFIYKYSFYLHEDTPLTDFILKGMAPRLIPIVFLYFLLVAIPASGKNLALKLLSKMAANNPNRKIWEPVLTGLWAGIITYGWTKSAPLLIRPVYAWQGQDMPGLVPPLYESGWIISFIVAMGVMLRQFFNQVFAERQKRDPFPGANEPAQNTISFNPAAAPAGNSLTRLIPRILLITLFTTFLLSGLYTGWYDALLFGAGALIATFLKLAVIPHRQGWKQTMSRIPFFLRFAGGILICWLFYTYIAAPNALHNAEAPQQQVFINSIFKNILYTMLLSMLYFVIIFPDAPASQKLKMNV